jgi:two-component system, NarL family, response regulator LiaR
MSKDNPIRVLLVEDQEITRFGLRLTLEQSAKVTVVGETSDGLAAVETAKACQPDVVLMDLGLPGINGIDASKQIKDLQPQTRIIMFTSHDSPDEVFAALSAGVEGYCLKTASGDQLIRAIESVYEGVLWLDPGIANRVLRNISTQTGKDNKTATKNGEFDLSPREIEVLGLLVEGLSNQEMAERLIISPETIKTHMRHIMEKLTVSDRTQAAVKALKHGLL